MINTFYSLCSIFTIIAFALMLAGTTLNGAAGFLRELGYGLKVWPGLVFAIALTGVYAVGLLRMLGKI